MLKNKKEKKKKRRKEQDGLVLPASYWRGTLLIPNPALREDKGQI